MPASRAQWQGRGRCVKRWTILRRVCTLHALRLLEILEPRRLLSASVVAESLFYKDSPFFDTGSDDAAIATDKSALLPGQTAGFANYSSYSLGINGIMVDISGAAGPLSAADFTFEVGNSSNPSSWALAPAPLNVINRAGAGTGGSTRIELQWADGAITNEWLQVTVLADASTGLLSNFVFYFGSAVGSAGITPGQVTSADELSARADPHDLLNPAAITDVNDFNRDGRVDAADQILARNETDGPQNALQMITVPPPPALVTISTVQLTAYPELVITGTPGDDTINVTQSGNTFTINNNGGAEMITGSFGALAIHAGSGGSTITVNPSVKIDTFVYGGAGKDIINNDATGSTAGAYNTVVTIGGGSDTVSGNGVSTYFWVDSSDTVNATVADIAGGRVQTVSAFYQPWSTDPNNANYVPLQLLGQNLKDPTDSGVEQTVPGTSLWGAGPALNDVRQGQLGDCFLMASLDSLAFSEPARLYQIAVDLGDGTYAVRFVRSGVVSYVRVDADLSSLQAAVSSSGGMWVPVIEKAYAYYRTGANTYASLDTGWMYATLQDLGCAASNILIPSPASETAQTDSALAATIESGLAAGHGLSIGTPATILDGAPLIASHAYAVLGVYYDSAAASWEIQLRNPWGFDGAGNDGNPNDGIVTISFAQLTANSSVIVSGY